MPLRQSMQRCQPDFYPDLYTEAVNETMHREYQKWYSPSLNRDMEFLIFGHHGARVIVFPTSRGKFYEWEETGMIGALGEHLENGWLQLFCLDSVDAESWYCDYCHLGDRAYRHSQYDSYIYNEV